MLHPRQLAHEHCGRAHEGDCLGHRDMSPVVALKVVQERWHDTLVENDAALTQVHCAGEDTELRQHVRRDERMHERLGRPAIGRLSSGGRRLADETQVAGDQRLGCVDHLGRHVEETTGLGTFHNWETFMTQQLGELGVVRRVFQEHWHVRKFCATLDAQQQLACQCTRLRTQVGGRRSR